MADKQMSRRGFVKGGLATIGAAALAGGISTHTFVPHANAGTPVDSAGVWKKNHCSCCSYQNCGTEVHVVDGVAVEVRGNADHPVNKGTLCPRSSAQLATLYNPYRVKAPLKRTNPKKGFDEDPGWVEVSWDEALDEVYEHLSATLEENPNAFAMQYGFSGGSLERNLIKATTMINESSNFLFSCGPLCEIHYSAFRFGGNHLDKPDLEHCRYIVDFGRSVGGSVMFASGPARVLAEALDDGLELIVVNPHQTPEASKGEWVPIRPSTDMAMLMAMLNVIFFDLDDYDKECCKFRTNAPYLIDSDGLYVRNPDRKPYVWDLADGVAKPYDDESVIDPALEGDFEVDGVPVTTCLAALKASVRETTPEWAEAKTTVPASTIRRIATDLVSHAQIGSTIDIDGVTMPYRPAIVLTGRGTTNSSQGRRAFWLANVINTLLGSTGCPGGIQASTAKEYIVDGDGMFEPTGMVTDPANVNINLPLTDFSMTSYFPLAVFPSVYSAATKAMIDPEAYRVDGKIKCMYFYGTNGIQADADPEEHADAYRTVDFIFMHALTLDEQSVFADIVLADSCHLERIHFREIGDMLAGDQESFSLVGGINFSYPAVDPVYNARQSEDAWVEFYHRMGPKKTALCNTFFSILAGRPKMLENPTEEYSFQELCDIAADALSPTGSKQYFIDNGFYVDPLPGYACYDYYETYLENGARHHIYDHPKLAIGKKYRSELERNGITLPGWENNMDRVYGEYIAIPKWIDDFINTENEEFDLLACNWKVSCRNLGEAMADSNPWPREIIEDWSIDDFAIQLNPATAEAKGLKTGDKIRVTSQHGGSVEGVLKTTNLLHPDAIGFPHSGGGKSMHASPLTRKGANYNLLLTTKPGYYIPDSGCLYNSARCKIEKIA